MDRGLKKLSVKPPAFSPRGDPLSTPISLWWPHSLQLHASTAQNVQILHLSECCSTEYICTEEKCSEWQVRAAAVPLKGHLQKIINPAYHKVICLKTGRLDCGSLFQLAVTSLS